MSITWTEQLWAEDEPIYQAILDHPFTDAAQHEAGARSAHGHTGGHERVQIPRAQPRSPTQ
jgi:hypothetical protein